jgi:lysylphosphatidylglycerol synthetase-like protein (DUF2156 family)
LRPADITVAVFSQLPIPLWSVDLMREEPDRPEKKVDSIVERAIEWFGVCVLAGVRRKVNELRNRVIENALHIVLTILALVLAVVFLSLSMVTALNHLMPLPVALAISGTIFIFVGLLFWKMGTGKKR